MKIELLRKVLLVSPLAFALVGCGEKAGVKEETQVTTPEGTKTITRETEVKTTGDNPPGGSVGTDTTTTPSTTPTDTTTPGSTTPPGGTTP